MAGLGEMLGNLWSTYMYKAAADVDSGNVPFSLIGVTLLAAVVILHVMGRHER